jgi:hypothetical protein
MDSVLHVRCAQCLITVLCPPVGPLGRFKALSRSWGRRRRARVAAADRRHCELLGPVHVARWARLDDILWSVCCCDPCHVEGCWCC